jgi:hypothetical protein
MSTNAWNVSAILHDTSDGLRVELTAVREDSDGRHTTSDVVLVTDEADARREARAFCRLLKVDETFAFEDRRKAA